jgi:lipopolysaccharide biosynthesis regulator YciM
VRASANNREVVAPAPGSSRVKLEVLEQAKIAEIDNAKRSYAKSHLIMGIIYADAGLLDNAEREFNMLLKENPQSLLARKLLRSVKSKRR